MNTSKRLRAVERQIDDLGSVTTMELASLLNSASGEEIEFATQAVGWLPPDPSLKPRRTKRSVQLAGLFRIKSHTAIEQAIDLVVGGNLDV